MRDPALVFRPHLMRAVDAAHAHDRGQQVEAARIIEHVLVGGPFRASVGRVEIERAAFIDTVSAQARVLWQIAVVLAFELDVAQIAVDLVGAGKQDRRARIVEPHRFEQRNRAADIHVEIEARLDQAGRHGNLRRKMENGPTIPDRFADCRTIPEIATRKRNLVGMARLQPFEIVLDTWARQRIEDQHRVTVARELIGEVDADKPGAAGDENGTRAKQRWRGRCHATSPLASSSRRA